MYLALSRFSKEKGFTSVLRGRGAPVEEDFVLLQLAFYKRNNEESFNLRVLVISIILQSVCFNEEFSAG